MRAPANRRTPAKPPRPGALRRCRIVTAAALLAPLSVGRKAPPSGLRITVEEAFLHCGRSLIRSRLRDTGTQIDRSCYPSYGQLLADQIRGANAAAIDASEDEANREPLY